VFDPKDLKDNATYAAPHALASGVHHLIVNGVQVLKDGKQTGSLPGMVLDR
jgi:N-acyl-D-amino-acid deacylase